MTKCSLCEDNIKKGILYGSSNASDGETKPICIKCLKRLLDSDGKDTALKERIEKWLNEENLSFSLINEPTRYFHFLLNDVGSLSMSIEIFQEKEDSTLFVGFMTFLSNELNERISQFNQKQREEFKVKVDEFLSSIRIDYRTGFRVNYEMISDRGHYGAKFFLRTNSFNCSKIAFLNMIEMVKESGEKADSFLNSQLLH